MKTCPKCARLSFHPDLCPHCRGRAAVTVAASALLLMGLAACDDKGPDPQPEYGVPATSDQPTPEGSPTPTVQPF